MPVIDLSAFKPVPATLGDANQIASGFQLIQSILNGIDNANFAAGKIFDPAKIMQNAATQGQALIWDSVSSTWKPGSLGSIAVDTTLVDVVSTVAETDIIGGAGTGISIPGGTLGTSRMIRVLVLLDMLNNTGGSQGFAPKIYYGGSSLVSIAQGIQMTTSTNRIVMVYQVILAALGATNAQIGEGMVVIGQPNQPGTIPNPAAGTPGVLAVDSTVAQNLRLTVTAGASSASLELRKRFATVEVI